MRKIGTKFSKSISLVLAVFWIFTGAIAVMGQDSTFTVTTEDQKREHPHYGEGYEAAKYAINGDQDPDLSLKRGNTYYFVMDNVPSFHPFYITTDPVGGGGDAYNKGVTNNGASGTDTLIFNVPSDAPNTLYYQCTNHDYMGTSISITGEATNIPPAASADIPTQIFLGSNYPNPFNPSTHIRFGLPKAQKVTVEIYNMLGERVGTVADRRFSAGIHEVAFDAGNLSSGVYLYRLQTPVATLTKSMTLLK